MQSRMDEADHRARVMGVDGGTTVEGRRADQQLSESLCGPAGGST